ncbi:MAG: RluA family pseudouridine synthase, partial [Bdellovibrionales bacterium]|nr:RluA family pseudouridine synthase [Bdellovibrionales bacterium]
EPDFEYLNRSKIKKLITAGKISIDGQIQGKAGVQVNPGAAIACRIDAPEESVLTPWEYPLEIAYEDEHLLVVNKPAGLTVHPGAGNHDKTLANALVAYFEQRQTQSLARVGIVHRLDKDTTGLLLVAKTESMLSALSDLIKERAVKRTYCCLVFVTPRAKRLVQREASGTIETLIGRHERKRTCMQVLQQSGRIAISHWKRIQELGYCCEVEVNLETGRTHQIRVHMDHVGSPVLGDQSYGDFSGLPHALLVLTHKFGRQALHAKRLEFQHPVTGEQLVVESPVPEDYDALRQAFSDFGVGN